MENEVIFKNLLEKLEISEDKRESIQKTLNKITRNLNKEYYGKEIEKETNLIVGSYGRKTATDNISDLDMLYILPIFKYSQYKNHVNNGPSKLLQEIKKKISLLYPKTKIRGDGQVVVCEFNKIILELCPVFKNQDTTFIYPDSNGAKWKKTNPIAEIKETKRFNEQVDKHHYNLCKILRAWKIHNGVHMCGLLIDTLCYNFLKNKAKEEINIENYLNLFEELFFEWSIIDSQKKHWLALGSNQKVYRKKKCNLSIKAKKALKNIKKIIENPEREVNYLCWKDLFGKYTPPIRISKHKITNTEEFIEDKFPIDIREEVKLKCDVEATGFRRKSLEDFLKSEIRLIKKAKLFFKIECNIKEEYDIFWKVRNEQEEAEKRDQIRGQIIKGEKTKREDTSFTGIHTVEVYIVMNEICIAKDRIDIPIK